MTIRIPVFWDFDLTVSDEYQQIPLFKKYESKIKAQLEKSGKTYEGPIDYFLKLANELHGDAGVDYMQQMAWDAQVAGCLQGLTNEELYEVGKQVKLAKGFVQALEKLKEHFEKEDVQVDHYFISVGIDPMIQGCIDANGLRPYVVGVAASEFFIKADEVRIQSDDKIIHGLKRIVTPFAKNQWIIGFLKGDQRFLNWQMKKSAYKYDSRRMVVIGDGFTDTSKFSYAKKKGGTPVCVYGADDIKAYHKATESVGEWVDFILPRDYTPGEITFSWLKKIIHEKATRKYLYSDSILYEFLRGKLEDPDLYKLTAQKISESEEMQLFFRKVRVDPSGFEKVDHIQLTKAVLKNDSLDEFMN